MNDIYLIRDADGSFEVDKALLDTDWYYFSTSFIVNGIKYHEYLVKGTEVVPVYEKKSIFSMFRQNKSLYRASPRPLDVRIRM